ncbi:MAG TPA: SRPBCC family protein, partial [Anaerolineales bacterium]|nr:SRPBCC family protein [Anaerolineales bacterium]
MYKNITETALRDAEDASTTKYRFQTVWWTPAAIERIWETLANYGAWPTWWQGIRKVEVLRRGDECGVGTVLRQWWRSRV